MPVAAITMVFLAGAITALNFLPFSFLETTYERTGEQAVVAVEQGEEILHPPFMEQRQA